MSESNDVTVRTDGAVGRIMLDRPSRANAYRDSTMDAFADGVASCAEDPSIRVMVIGSTTEGIFCSGADLDELGRRSAKDALTLRSLRVFDRLAGCSKPTIAAIDGPAVAGGCELALACDLRIASDRARFGMPETSLGLIPAAGATFRLPGIVGDAVAKQMILFGAEFDAQQALACGLVHEVVAAGELDARVDWWAAKAAERDPLALELAKRAMSLAVADGGGRDFTSCAQAVLYERRHRGDGEVP